MLTRNRSILYVGGAIAIGTTVAALMPALPAVGDHSPPGDESPPAPVVEVVLADTATGGARGAVVQLRVDVSCSEHADAYLEVEISERSGTGIAEGSEFVEEVVCDGAFHTTTIPVLASRMPFNHGTAFARARASAIFPYPNYQSAADEDARQIQVVGP